MVSGLARSNYNPDYILFKYSVNSGEKRISPDSVSSVEFINDKLLESKYLTENSRPVFVETVVKGKLSLYLSSANTFYAQKGDSLMIPLTNQQKELVVDGRVVKMDSKEYIGMLSILTNDCPEVMSSVAKLRLKESDLSKYIHSYNLCRGDASEIIRADLPGLIIHLGLSAGINNAKLLFDEPDGNLSLIGDNIETSTSVLFGADISLVDPRLSTKFGLYAGIFFTNTDLEYKFEHGNSQRFFRQTLSILKVPVAAQYELVSFNKFTLFLHGGFASHVYLKNSHSFDIEYFNGTEDVLISEILYGNETKVALGFWGGISLNRQLKENKLLFLDMRFERTNGVSDMVDLIEHMNHIQINGGIRFRMEK